VAGCGSVRRWSRVAAALIGTVGSAVFAYAQSANPVGERVLREGGQGRSASVEHAGAASYGAHANSERANGERTTGERTTGERTTGERTYGEWSDVEGTLLDGMLAEWRVTGDARYFNYVQQAVDATLGRDGSIHVGDRPFPADAHALDDIEMGRSVVALYRVTQQPRYAQAARFLQEQMERQPKNVYGGYWHGQSSPNQMRLKDAYLAGPFLATYAHTFLPRAAGARAMDEVIDQLLLMHERMADPTTGLLRPGWDAARKVPWADRHTSGRVVSTSRAVGWYAMALMDVLERVPDTDPQRAALEDVARSTLQAVVREQDQDSGLWRGVLVQADKPGNDFDPSASCMVVYALAKGVRTGVLPLAMGAAAEKGWLGLQARFVKPDGTIGMAKDATATATYLLASSEMQQRVRAGALLQRLSGRQVLFDGWFNAQKRRAPVGHEDLSHYRPDDDAASGYSVFARMFEQYGMRTATLDHAPREADLRGVAVYMIAAPGSRSMDPKANLMDAASAAAIAAWVRSGGVLMMMENDSEHAEQVEFNQLAGEFGIHFNAVKHNHAVGGDDSTALVPIPAGTGGIFHEAHMALMIDVCTLEATAGHEAAAGAKVILTHHDAAAGTDDGIMAVAHLGSGTVYANVDPWLYNEYTDGRRLPLAEDNFAAGQELVRWIVEQVPERPGAGNSSL
jgi:unsaturated rhamnogalacturonyl hydrolase